MMRFRLGAAVVIMLACSCSSEPTSTHADPPATLTLFGTLKQFAVSYGQSVQLTPVLSDSAGAALTMPAGLEIVVRDTTVASVDGSYVLHTKRSAVTTVVGTLVIGGKVFADSISVVVACGGVGGATFTPASQSLTIGQTFTAHVAELTPCGNPDTFTWDSSDPTVATIDSISGLTTAIAPGHASVRAHGKRVGAVGGIPVTVTAP